MNMGASLDLFFFPNLPLPQMTSLWPSIALFLSHLSLTPSPPSCPSNPTGHTNMEAREPRRGVIDEDQPLPGAGTGGKMDPEEQSMSHKWGNRSLRSF